MWSDRFLTDRNDIHASGAICEKSAQAFSPEGPEGAKYGKPGHGTETAIRKNHPAPKVRFIPAWGGGTQPQVTRFPVEGRAESPFHFRINDFAPEKLHPRLSEPNRISIGLEGYLVRQESKCAKQLP